MASYHLNTRHNVQNSDAAQNPKPFDNWELFGGLFFTLFNKKFSKRIKRFLVKGREQVNLPNT